MFIATWNKPKCTKPQLINRYHSPCSSKYFEITKLLLDTASKFETDIQRYSPTLMAMIALVKLVLCFAVFLKLGRWLFVRFISLVCRAGFDFFGADCVARGSGGGT